MDSLIQVSRALTAQNDFDKALEINAFAEKIALEKLGRVSAAYGSCCFNHGRVLYYKADTPQAEKWYLESKGIREKVLGREHPDYAQSLNNLGTMYNQMGSYEMARQYHLETISIRGRVLGKEHPDYATSLNNLAIACAGMGDYDKAEQVYLEALSIRERVLGKETPDYAQSLDNLGLLYLEKGDYAKSERLHLEASAIRARVLGKDRVEYAFGIGNLALLYNEMGNYAKAEKLFLEVQTIIKRNLGIEHPFYALCLNSLANSYWQMRNYKKAEQLYMEAHFIFEKRSGKEHPDYIANLDNLALLCHEMGDDEKAEQLHIEATDKWERVLGKANPKYCGSLMSLACFYADTDNYPKSEQYFLEIKAIVEKALGKAHPLYAENFRNLAYLYYKMKDYSKAEEELVQLSDLNQSLMAKALHHLSERELDIYLQTFLEEQALSLSLAQVAPLKTTRACQVSYNNSLYFKGFLLNAIIQIKRLALKDTLSTEKFYLLKSYEHRLAVEYSKPISEQKNVSILEEKINVLEKDLASNVAGYEATMHLVKWQEILGSLNPGEAAIEFVNYRYYSSKPTDSITYAALILCSGDTSPQFIPLFEKNELKELMRGASGGSNFLKINALYSQKSLYDLIWKPLEPLLTGIKTIYCAPSGLLHRLNLAAMATPEGQVYGERRQVVVMGSSTRQLAVGNGSQTSSNDAYLAGGIRYDSDSSVIAYANRGASSRSIEPSALTFQPDSLSITRGGVLDYLPATAAEVQEIGQTLRSVSLETKIDTGFYATEESFRQLGVGKPSPRIIHLATHGYFFPDPIASNSRQLAAGSEPVFKMSEHPMIRSGLILAGAKQAWLTGKHSEGLEDGILTAYEISQMNLSGTELVVLSACETGLGDIVGNEGVYGLQRAFKIAGAKYLIMSLWKVDDRSTQAFMTSFYRHWLTEKTDRAGGFPQHPAGDAGEVFGRV